MKKTFHELSLNWQPGYFPMMTRFECGPSISWRYVYNHMGTSWGRQEVFQGRFFFLSKTSIGRPLDVIFPND